MIELVVVVVVTALLSSIAVVGVSGYVTRAQDAAALEEVSRVGKDAPRVDLSGSKDGVDLADMSTSVSRMASSDGVERTLAAEGVPSTSPAVFSSSVTREDYVQERVIVVVKKSASGACAAGLFNAAGGAQWLDVLPAEVVCRAPEVASFLYASTGLLTATQLAAISPGNAVPEVVDNSNASTTPVSDSSSSADGGPDGDLQQGSSDLDGSPGETDVLQTRPAQQWGVWDYAFYSSAPLDLTNNVSVSSGSVYSRTSASCDSSSSVAGHLVTPGDVDMTNTCSVQGVWSGGDVSTSSTPVVDGDVWTTGEFTAGNHTVSLRGDVLAGGGITSSDGKPLTASGRLLPGSTVTSPDLVPMPLVYGDSSYWQSRGFTVTSWAQFAQDTATANSAPSWVDFLKDPCKQVSSASWSVNGAMSSPSTPTVLDARSSKGKGCELTWTGPNTLRLFSDLTILVDSFTTSGKLRVSSGDGGKYTLRIVAPWPSSQLTCERVTSSSPQRISFAGSDAVVDPLVPVLLYSPTRVTLNNFVTASGQVYACDVQVANNITWSSAYAAP